MRNNENNENVLTLCCSDVFNCFDVHSFVLRCYEYDASDVFS